MPSKRLRRAKQRKYQQRLAKARRLSRIREYYSVPHASDALTKRLAQWKRGEIGVEFDRVLAWRQREEKQYIDQMIRELEERKLFGTFEEIDRQIANAIARSAK